MRMKINPDEVTVNNIDFIVDLCYTLMKYHTEQCLCENDISFKKYHEGRANAYANILDAFEVRGIIEEDSEDE